MSKTEKSSKKGGCLIFFWISSPEKYPLLDIAPFWSRLHPSINCDLPYHLLLLSHKLISLPILAYWWPNQNACYFQLVLTLLLEKHFGLTEIVSWLASNKYHLNRHAFLLETVSSTYFNKLSFCKFYFCFLFFENILRLITVNILGTSL